MKYLFNSLIYLTLICSIVQGKTQTFEPYLLPIGDPQKKFDFSQVKLDHITSTRTNQEISFEEMIEDLRKKRIVMIGESHTNQLHHDIQFEIIKGLTEYGQPVVLSLEMYNPTQNESLAKWSRGEIDPDDFMEKTGYLDTWGHNYRYYQAIFEYAREHQLPMYGANVDRSYASKIGRGGLESLTTEEMELLPHIDTSNHEHKYLINILMEGMGATMPQFFKNMYPAQCLWDCAMGEESIHIAQRHPDATVVILAGSGHVIYNLGIGRVLEDQSNLAFASVIPIDIEEETNEGNTAHGMGMSDGTPSKVVARSYGDYLWGQPEENEERYPSLGISLDEPNNKGTPVKRIFPGTIAYENGLRTGDIIHSINGQTFDDLFSLKKFLQFINWEDTLTFQISREGEREKIECKVQP